MAAEYISQCDFQVTDSLNKSCIHKVYLVTYSQVDEEKCSDRERFAEMVLGAFDPRKENSVQPVQWAVSKEPHSESGFYYHIFVKFSNSKRWYGAKVHLLVNWNISVHFNDSYQNYIFAYRYVTKEDTEVFHSPGHPDLDSARSPQTSEANKALMEKRRSKQATSEVQHTSKSYKCKRISKSNVMDIIKSRGIRSET